MKTTIEKSIKRLKRIARGIDGTGTEEMILRVVADLERLAKQKRPKRIAVRHPSGHLVVELNLARVDEDSAGALVTFHEAARALRALGRDFEAEAGGAELLFPEGKPFTGVVYDRDGDEAVVGTWRVKR